MGYTWGFRPLFFSNSWTIGMPWARAWPWLRLKGTVPRDFRLQAFLWISFPQAPEYTKIYLYVNSTTQRCSKKIIKTFLIEVHKPPVSTTPVSTTPVVHLELRISPRLFEKIRNDPNVVYVIFGDWGEDDSWKKPEAKNLATLSL